MTFGPARPLRISHVIAGLDPAHGGPSYSVPRLCRALADTGVDTTLLSVAMHPSGVRDGCETGYRDQRFAWDYARIPVLRGLRASSGLARALNESSNAADVIHNHGLWLLPNVEAGRAAKRAKIPLVVAPRGMLSPAALAFSQMKKQIFWRLLQGAAISRAECIHVTSEQEHDDVRAFGLSNPVAVIPNGVDVDDFATDPVGGALADRVVLSLGRIHPIKGLDRLIRAWARLEAVHPGWRLRIVGPEELGYGDQLRELIAAEGLTRVAIDAPVRGSEKAATFRDADLFVLPTLNENFAMTVAEALAAGTPVICTKGAPWRGLEDERCGWWIDHGVEPLAEALGNAMSLPREMLNEMGRRGRAWMVRDFSWDRVARDMTTVYSWLIRGSEPPEAVRFS